MGALTNDSSQTTCCEVFPTIQLDLGLRERLLECRHFDCLLFNRSRSIAGMGGLGALIVTRLVIKEFDMENDRCPNQGNHFSKSRGMRGGYGERRGGFIGEGGI